MSAAVDRLEAWEDAGAAWRVAELGRDRALVLMCACTGEEVERLESDDPALLAYLRRRPSSASP
jgi:hypothetical protein